MRLLTSRVVHLSAAVLVFTAACAPAATPPAPTAAPAPKPTSAPAAAPAAKPTAAPAAQAAKPAAETKPAAEAKPAAAAKPAEAKPAAASGGQASNFFAGKTVTAVVNFSAGGPTDTFARMLVQYLPKHLPGNPTIVVQNMGGGGGNIGTQHLYAATKNDGLTMGILTAAAIDQLVAPERIPYDVTKFEWLGGVSETQVSYVRTDLGVKHGRELPNAPNQIVVGGLGAESNKDLGERMFLNMLGAKYKYVTGYPGNNDVRAALLRNEVNFFEESLTGWFTAIQPLVQDSTVLPVAQRGVLKDGSLVRDARIPEIPTMEELAVELHGPSVKQGLDYRGLLTVIQASLLSRSIVYPPGTPQDVVEVMRKGIVDTFADPEFKAAASKQLSYDFEGMSGAEAQELIVKSVEQASKDKEALEYVRKLTKEA